MVAQLCRHAIARKTLQFFQKPLKMMHLKLTAQEQQVLKFLLMDYLIK